MRILVVGAGIAGATVAYWLHRGGHEVTLVERAPKLREGGYLVDFWGAGFDVAERMGIVPELRRRGYVFTEAKVVDRAGRRIASLTPAAIMRSGERYVSITRSDLAAAIYAALGGSAELVLGDTVATLDDLGDRVRVSFEGGRVEDFDLVVGADGLHSRVRRLAFGPDADYEKYLGIVVAAFEVDGYRPRDELVALMHAEVGFQVLRVSLRDDRTLVLFSVRHSGDAPHDRDAQQRLLRSKLADGGWETPAILDRLPAAASFYFDSVSQIRMPSWSRGRVVLVGDAGACPSFLAGQGSALAMVEAYTLAAELARCADHTSAFVAYEQRLSGLVRSKQDGALGLGAAFAPANRLQLLVRNTAMKLMGLPGLADAIMGRSFHDAVELPPFAPMRHSSGLGS